MNKFYYLTAFIFLFLTACGSQSLVEPVDIPITITLNGPEIIEIAVGDVYIEYGVKTLNDSDYLESLKISGDVNTLIAGTYRLRYKVLMEDGRESNEIIREVRIMELNFSKVSNDVRSIVTIDSHNSFKLFFNDENLLIYAENGINPRRPNDLFQFNNLLRLDLNDAIKYIIDSEIKSDEDTLFIFGISSVSISRKSSIEQIILENMPSSAIYHLYREELNINYNFDQNNTTNINFGFKYFIDEIIFWSDEEYVLSDLSSLPIRELIELRLANRVQEKIDNTIPPKIELIGPEKLILSQGSEYFEFGAISTDAFDIVLQVEIIHSINMDVIGEYSVIYLATDKSGNQSIVNRSISIVSNDPAKVHRTLNHLGEPDGRSIKVGEEYKFYLHFPPNSLTAEYVPALYLIMDLEGFGNSYFHKHGEEFWLLNADEQLFENGGGTNIYVFDSINNFDSRKSREVLVYYAPFVYSLFETLNEHGFDNYYAQERIKFKLDEERNIDEEATLRPLIDMKTTFYVGMKGERLNDSLVEYTFIIPAHPLLIRDLTARNQLGAKLQLVAYGPSENRITGFINSTYRIIID